MTPLQLLDALEAFVKQETKDILLPVRVDRKSGENKERAAEVYKMRLPNKTAQTERVPYLLLQYIKSTDTQEPGQEPESELEQIGIWFFGVQNERILPFCF